MADRPLTMYRLAEEIRKMLGGGEVALASEPSEGDIRIAIGQVCNSLLKVEHFGTNLKMDERIPNGSVLAYYDGIEVRSTGNRKSAATLPARPIKLPRNMGIFSVYLTHLPEQEFVPLQMGQLGMLRSQPLISDVLGQIAYENFGDLDIHFNKDLAQLYPNKTLSMRLVIFDINLYGDYDILPIPAEMELPIKQEVLRMFAGQPVQDNVVDSTTKEQTGVPIRQQQQP